MKGPPIENCPRRAWEAIGTNTGDVSGLRMRNLESNHADYGNPIQRTNVSQ